MTAYVFIAFDSGAARLRLAQVVIVRVIRLIADRTHSTLAALDSVFSLVGGRASQLLPDDHTSAS